MIATVSVTARGSVPWLLTQGDIPPMDVALLVKPLSGLPPAKVAAVLAARQAWVDAGLTSDRATRRAVLYAGKLAAQWARAVRRLRRGKHPWRELHKAADSHRKHVKRVLTQAYAAGRLAIPVTDLEELLRRRDLSGLESLTAAVPAVLTEALERPLTELFLDIMEAGAAVAVRQLEKAA